MGRAPKVVGRWGQAQLAVLTACVVMLASGAVFAAPVTLIDNSAWTYFLTSGEISSGAVRGSHEIVADFGGSLQVSLNGYPGALDGVQPTLAPIHAGDLVTLSLAHSDLDSASQINFYLADAPDTPGSNAFYHNEQSRDGEPINQAYDATWIADADYSAGTNFYFHAVVWPGSATYWLIDATATPTPEPATLSLLALGGFATMMARRRKKN